MAISLQDQLLKAGIASKTQAKNAKAEKRKSKKSKQPTAADVAADQTAAAAAVAALLAKPEKDPALNHQRQQEQQQKAAAAEVRQLIAQHQETLPKDADVRYNFAHEKQVKALWVTQDQFNRLARAQLRITWFDNSYAVIAADAVSRIEARLAGVVLPLPEGTESSNQEDDDYYAQFEIPDDLMW